jgi:hypothetical protein
MPEISAEILLRPTRIGFLTRPTDLASVRAIKLLNKMAGGLRRKSNEQNTIEETFELRTAPLKEWTDLISARKARRHSRRIVSKPLRRAMSSGSAWRPIAHIATPKTGPR